MPDEQWARGRAAFLGHFAEHDRITADDIQAWAGRLRSMGREVGHFVYPGTQHAFFNDTRPAAHDREAARLAWQRTLEFLYTRLGLSVA